MTGKTEEIHCVPSGADKSLCGLDEEKIEYTSLGMWVTCPICRKKGQEICDIHYKKNKG